ncbi:Methylmalonate-semialdehyde dehydrogenase [acylating] mitochondrial [Schaereria dolodes]|nr:Methylmalonate-semialdehyde dehydrogenase [acylating] mitochondrial [Schaereria dolodes]
MATQSSSTSSVDLWVDSHVRHAFQKSLNSLPPLHLLPIEAGEVYPTRELAIARIKDFAFSQGYVVVGSGGGPFRARLCCCQHGKETKNSRRLTEENRKRKTKSQASGCPYKAYAVYKKQPDGSSQWTIGLTCPSHTHTPLPDPFRHKLTKDRHPGYQLAMQNALRDRKRQIPYATAIEDLGGDDDYIIDSKDYYNLYQPPKNDPVGGQRRRRPKKLRNS